ncbi:MAG: ABC transporter permease [Oscillospiraceae bacterium]|jgi:ribose transport system permease protein|nr:ABC transporter permease [Oscillospiraceae bacterium]
MAQAEIKAEKRPRKSALKTLGNYSFILIFLCIFLTYIWVNGGATTISGVMNILRHSTVVGIIAFGMGLVIITGGIDLSVGSMLSLIGGFSVEVFNKTNSPIATLLFALAMGFVLGMLNGVLVGKVRMPAFIVTLATMMIYRSMAQYYLRAAVRKSIYNMNGQLSAYDAFYGFGQQKLLSVPVVGLVLIAVTIIMVFITTSTKYGKSVFAVGSNEKAAQLAGINVSWTRSTVYIITGVLCGLAAFIWLAMNGSVDPATLGKSNEMYAIAAVVIGGVSMAGGKGKLLGVLFGAMSYTIIDKIIASLRMDALINDTIKGTILLVAVLIQIMIPVLRGKMVKKTI